jgi:formate dehydrogenase gamma subunit
MKSSNAAGFTKFDGYFFLALFYIFLGAIANYQFAFGQERVGKIDKPSIKTAGVCPPFYLLDENGQVINPFTDTNASLPYSPKKTCGACHDYDKITKGYHFTQGAGENPTVKQSERCQWVTTPGNYGGSWCSPAPLYRYLSSKNNSSPRMMDMTSFSFITAGCGKCHPGGGSMEYDRDGRRYDLWMADHGSSLIPGGDNRFDGDYYQAQWSQTGVLEADCLMCHLPEYSFNARNKQLKSLNFRWAPTAAAGFGEVKGAVGKGDAVKVIYEQAKFNPDGTISPHIVREARNEACLACHAKPGWKKRGANFRSRTDVHLRAGMKCIDCHPAGSKAVDDRIKGKEVHQFGKGDDPGGQIRNDLDNTCRDCIDCHNTGYLGAPIARHRWLPPLHLNRIACQTCHIPERAVKSALVQAGDVFNPGTKIPTKGKHLWTFYGPDMKYWNHYGDLEMMGYDDKPTDSFKPVLSRYKGKIFPVNRVHSIWPALELEGKTGLMQPRMSEIYKMWTDHHKDPAKYTELGKIKDDNQDGIPEINRPEEIDALISAVTAMLKSTGYPMDGKKVVWVINDRVYSSGRDSRSIEKQDWEASPYANVHKYNHDVYPARSAMGIKTCMECHGFRSHFFFASVLKYPFDENAKPITEPQYNILGIGKSAALLGAFRESVLKLFAPWVLIFTLVVLLLHFTLYGRTGKPPEELSSSDKEIPFLRFRAGERMSHFLIMVSFLILGITGIFFLMGRNDPLGPWARQFHGWTGLIFLLGFIFIIVNWLKDMKFQPGDRNWLRALGGYFGKPGKLPAGKFNAGQKIFFRLTAALVFLLAVTGISIILLKPNEAVNLSLFYTIHDLAAVILLPFIMVHLYLGIICNPRTIWCIFGGYVNKTWLLEHHPDLKLTEDD